MKWIAVLTCKFIPMFERLVKICTPDFELMYIIKYRKAESEKISCFRVVSSLLDCWYIVPNMVSSSGFHKKKLKTGETQGLNNCGKRFNRDVSIRNALQVGKRVVKGTLIRSKVNQVGSETKRSQIDGYIKIKRASKLFKPWNQYKHIKRTIDSLASFLSTQFKID